MIRSIETLWARDLRTLAVIGVFATLGAGTSDRNGADTAQSDPAGPAEPAPEPSDREVPNGVELRSITVSVPDYKPDGRAWDIGDGPPDPFVRVRQDGFLVFQSDVERDTYEAVFPVTVRAILDPARPFTVEVIDRDVSAHDAIDTVQLEPGQLRGRGRHRTRVFVELSAPAAPSAATGPWRDFSLARGRWGTDPDGPPPIGPVLVVTVVEHGPATLGELADQVTLPNGYSFGVTDAGQPVIFGPESAVYSFSCVGEEGQMFCTFDRYDGNGYPTTEVIVGPPGECEFGIRIGHSCVNGFAVE